MLSCTGRITLSLQIEHIVLFLSTLNCERKSVRICKGMGILSVWVKVTDPKLSGHFNLSFHRGFGSLFSCQTADK